MAEIDIETTISDIRLFIEKLKADLPEVFPTAAAPEQGAEDAAVINTSGKVLYTGMLLDCEIILNPDIEAPSCALQDGRLLTYIKTEIDDVSALADSWLRAQANEILPKRIAEWAQKIGVQYNNIVIKDQKTMWASCSQKNNLNFSYRIIKMPNIVIDYLIVHELVHLIHFNHGEDYWATVEQYCPGYKEHRKWLNSNKYAVLADSDIKYTPAPPPAITEDKPEAPAPNV